MSKSVKTQNTTGNNLELHLAEILWSLKRLCDFGILYA